jgi:hypothetical protein
MRSYTIPLAPTTVTVGNGARTLIQVIAGTNRSYRILSAYISQTGTTTNQQVRIRLLRKTAAATLPTATTPTPLVVNDTAFTGTASTGLASAEGTDGTVIAEDVWSALSGWVYKPIPEEFAEVPGAGIIAIKIPAALTADLIIAGYLTIQEVG